MKVLGEGLCLKMWTMQVLQLNWVFTTPNSTLIPSFEVIFLFSLLSSLPASLPFPVFLPPCRLTTDNLNGAWYYCLIFFFLTVTQKDKMSIYNFYFWNLLFFRSYKQSRISNRFLLHLIVISRHLLIVHFFFAFTTCRTCFTALYCFLPLFGSIYFLFYVLSWWIFWRTIICYIGL